MKLALVGVGDAGVRIADQILAYGAESDQDFSNGNVIGINTDEGGFESVDRIPKDQQILLGDLHPEVNGQGVDGDIELAIEIAREELDEIRRAFDSMSMYNLDGVMVIAGLAGGTGSGVGAVLFEELQRLFDAPVYGVGVLPHDDEGNQAALAASRTLLTIVPSATNVVLFDNETWFSSKQTLEENYASANRALARRVVTLIGAGEHEDAKIPENCIDPTDIMRTLEIGGVSSIGYAETELDRHTGVIGYLYNLLFSNADEPPNALQIKELVQRAVRGKLTVPCEVASAERIVIIVMGPSDSLSRRGFENARHWLEEQTGTVEIRAGDEPREGSSTISVVALFSNVTDIPGINRMQEVGVAAKHNQEREAFGWTGSDEAEDSEE